MIYRVYNTVNDIIFDDKIFSTAEEAKQWLTKENYDPNGVFEDRTVDTVLHEPDEDDAWGWDAITGTGVMWEPETHTWKVMHWRL